MASLTFRCSAGNGAVYASGASWATVRSAAAGSTSTYNQSLIDVAGFGGLIRSQNLGGGSYDIIRAFFPFDTSSIPDGAVISSAVFSIYGYSTTNNDNSSAAALVGATPASNTVLADGDFDQVGSTRFCDSDIAFASWSTAGYNNFTLNATGIAAVAKAGYTVFGLRTSHDLDNSAPAGTNKIGGYTNGAAEANSPKLVITYTQATVSAFML